MSHSTMTGSTLRHSDSRRSTDARGARADNHDGPTRPDVGSEADKRQQEDDSRPPGAGRKQGRGGDGREEPYEDGADGPDAS